MKLAMKQFSQLILVCVNEKDNGRDCCAKKLSLEFYQTLKTAVAEFDPTIRVAKTSCLGNCASGAVMAIMPKNVYLGDVTETDIPEIIKMLA
jgi:(2Fe-2S) ferredoxin